MRLHRTVAAERRPRRWISSIAGAGLGLAIFTGGVSGCSLLYNLDTAQCSSNTDCDALGGVFVGLACENHLCVAPTTGCDSNAECIDTEGGGTKPYVCRERECIALTTAECPTILPQLGEGWRTNLRSETPLILAGTGVISGSANNYDTFLKNYDLALTEFTQQAIGIQAGAYPLVMLGCKATYDSPEELDRMMTHLVDVVKVPGFIAAMGASNLQRAFVEKGKGANLFIMSAFPSDPTLASLETNGLVWYVGPGAEFIARPYAPLLTRVLAHLAVAGTVRVATVVSSDNRLATNTLAAIRDEPANFGIAFNGKSVFDNGTDYLGVSVANADQSLVAQVGQLLDFLPHVIFSVADDRFFSEIVPQVEAGWTAAAAGQPRPFYILSALNYNSEVLQHLTTEDSTLASRMVGVNGQAAVEQKALRDYTTAWNEAFPEDRGVKDYENFYDAAYYLMFAAAGAGQFLTNDGNDFKRGMARLLSGPDHYVGYTGIPPALQALAPANATITLNGTLGPPDFNPLDGTRQSPGSVWCIDAASVYHGDVLRYVPGADAASASLSGSFPTACIPRF